MQNPLKKRIGILGGGQLGRMLMMESTRYNVHFNVLDKDDSCPCKPMADVFLQGGLDDDKKIFELAAISDLLTFEIEHVNTDALLALEEKGVEIIPSPKILQIVQDKGLQKQFYKKNNIPSSDFFLVETANEWLDAINKLGTFKFVAKTRKDGYDGKGVAILQAEEILNDISKIPFSQPCMLEAFVECEKELSVIVARNRMGNTVSYPSVEMEFDPDANLVTYLTCPAKITAEQELKAEEIAMNVVKAFNGVGIFAVEMFLTKEGQILVNEVAPRTHNSGHHTIEACYSSQFEQLTRILLDLPLGSTRLIKPAVMINLLGADGFSGSYRLKGLEEISAIEGVYVHLYGKSESKPMRKMGHITILGETIAEAHKKAELVNSLICFVKD